MGSPWQSRPPEGFEKWLENPVLQPTENFASFDDFERATRVNLSLALLALVFIALRCRFRLQ